MTTKRLKRFITMLRPDFPDQSKFLSRQRRSIMNDRAKLMVPAILVGLIFSTSAAFIPNIFDFRGIRRSIHLASSAGSPLCPRRHNQLSMSDDKGENNSIENSKNNDKNDNNATNNIVLDDISWRVAKVRLEEANTKRFLKRKPLKLPYEISRRWIQHNWAPKTKEEFNDLVANGDLRNVYISKRPEEYYGERGEWISWDHYLLGSLDSNNSTDDGRQEIMKWQ